LKSLAESKNQKPSQQSGLGAFAALIGILLVLFFNLFALFIAWLWLLYRPTTVEVTKDAIIIDDKKLRRADFGNFHVSHTRDLPDEDEKVAVLGYSYGNRNFKFGGAWPHSLATEVASALNKHLRATPQTGDEHRPSPEQLRRATQANEF
jgi:hypothetical protein